MRRLDFMPEMKEMRPFRYWCQKVLPLVYDDSLGYYELLNKVVDYINNMTKDVASLGESYQKLEEYVNSHLDTAYIKSLVDEELDRMVEDGTFDEIVQTALDSKFNAYAETINGIIEEQNETIEEQTNTLNTRLSAQDNRITSQNTVIMSQQTRLGNLTTDVNNLTTTTNGHTEDISGLNSDVSALDTTVSGHTTNLNTLNSTVADQGTDISSLQTNMTSALNSINAHTSAISSINSFITRSVITLPHLDAPTVGGASSFSKDSLVAWLKYVVSHYGSEITNKPFMGKYTSTTTNLLVGFAYSMNDLVDGVPRYSFFITWSNNKTFVFGTYNGVAYFRESANYTDRT